LTNDGDILLGANIQLMPQTNFKSIKSMPRGKNLHYLHNFLIIKINKEGKIKWKKNIFLPLKENLSRIIKLKNGDYLLAGTQINAKSRKGDSNFLLIKLKDPDMAPYIPIPLEAIPNPAHDFTQLIINKNYTKGIIRVIDLEGKVINETKIYGETIVPIDLKGLLPSIYIIEVTADTQKNSIKIIKN